MSTIVKRHLAHLAVALLRLMTALVFAAPAWARPAPYGSWGAGIGCVTSPRLLRCRTLRPGVQGPASVWSRPSS